MPRVLRSIAAVVAGFVVASAIMMVVEFTNGRLIHPDLAKAAEGMKDPQALRELLASAPVSAFLVVLFGWIAGGFAGGWVAARMAPSNRMRHALILGALLTLAGIANNLMIPPPLWFWVVSVLVFLPAAQAGGGRAGAN